MDFGYAASAAMEQSMVESAMQAGHSLAVPQELLSRAASSPALNNDPPAPAQATAGGDAASADGQWRESMPPIDPQLVCIYCTCILASTFTTI